MLRNREALPKQRACEGRVVVCCRWFVQVVLRAGWPCTLGKYMYPCEKYMYQRHRYMYQREQYMYSRHKYMYRREKYMYQRHKYMYRREKYMYQRHKYMYQREKYMYSRHKYMYQRDKYMYSRHKYMYQREKYMYSRHRYMYLWALQGCCAAVLYVCYGGALYFLATQWWRGFQEAFPRYTGGTSAPGIPGGGWPAAKK